MKYPCIVYSLCGIAFDHADDISYRSKISYKLTYISKTPCDKTVEEIARLPMCRFDRFYAAEGLNHYVYILYF